MLAADNSAAVDRFLEAAQLWADNERRGELRCLWAAGEAARRTNDPRSVQLLRDIEARCVEGGLEPACKVGSDDRCGMRGSAPVITGSRWEH